MNKNFRVAVDGGLERALAARDAADFDSYNYGAALGFLIGMRNAAAVFDGYNDSPEYCYVNAAVSEVLGI